MQFEFGKCVIGDFAVLWDIATSRQPPLVGATAISAVCLFCGQAQAGVNERRFPNISALVEHYVSRGENNGLQCALKAPVAEKHTSGKLASSRAMHAHSFDTILILTVKKQILREFSIV